MRRGKNRSDVSIPVTETFMPEATYITDTLTVKIQNIRITDPELKRFAIKVAFYDQLILSGSISSISARDEVKDRTIIKGYMNYDPSDYERMSLLVDNPLCVTIQPVTSAEQSSYTHIVTSEDVLISKSSSRIDEPIEKALEDVSACNVDILALFIDQYKMHVSKRMQPLVKPSVLQCKSWDNLPLLTMKLKITRNPQNRRHHEVLKQANYMKITLVASYNMLIPYDDDYIYTAASKMPVQNDTNVGLVMFNQGYRVPKRFYSTSIYPKWESLRVGDQNFTEGDEKMEFMLDELQNDDLIPLENYVRKKHLTTVWASFHRTLILEDSDNWLRRHVRQFYWPLELHMYSEKEGYSFMAFLNLFKLMYAGEDTVRLAVPLHWINADLMQQKCGCEPLLTPNEKASSVITPQKNSRSETGTVSGSADQQGAMRTTGFDDNCAFVIVEVKLAHPLRPAAIPPYVTNFELNEMLNEVEQAGPLKRECSGRGQLNRDWQATINIAANSLRRVPYYGTTEFCTLNRQLSETRTRVELTTSFWQDAAVFVNNNFVVQHFLHSNETYEEMLMMAHACLMKTALETLVGVESRQQIDSTLRAARHARQMQDISHAMELYIELVVQKPRSASSWRELATCLLDADRECAAVCINKAIALNPRHHLSLLAKGCMLMDEDPELAEPFFVALVGLYPFWTTGWVITSVYYFQRELFYMADTILEQTMESRKEELQDKLGFPRGWEHELGDWWDHTPLLPGTSHYYDAADLLLRLRAITLAEACISRALAEAGETAVYYHLVALCCRLRGKVEDALCHIRAGIQKFGEISYLRTLEAECYHVQNKVEETRNAFEKAGACIGGFSALLSISSCDPQRARTVLVDLLRRQPSAYAWMALSDDWLNRAAMGEGGEGGGADQAAARACAAACCVQALQLDRRAGRAWATLAALVGPSARRLHCLQMARSKHNKTLTIITVRLRVDFTRWNRVQEPVEAISLPYAGQTSEGVPLSVM